MPELQRLRADHASAVLDFELANRAYFAASISDRGDEFYEESPPMPTVSLHKPLHALPWPPASSVRSILVCDVVGWFRLRVVRW